MTERDQKAIWHPFTHLKRESLAIPLVRGEGACFYDDNGKRYIDGIASWWVNTHGHCHPYLIQKTCEQMMHLEHAIFSGFTHLPAVQLAERILSKLPRHLGKVFFSDDGSTAVEVAIKMALQFWHNNGTPKYRIIAFEGAYHGDTFGGMSVGERNVFNQAFTPCLFEVIHIPFPSKGREGESLLALQKAMDQSIAAFIFEPLVQGAAGMRMYREEVLDQMIEYCRKNSVLTIADEVMTGFGRTGKMFATDFLKISPDIICLSKGLTGGMLPLGLTVCADFIYDSYVTEDRYKTFFHGHSYTGNPTACAAALASLDLFEENSTWENINRIQRAHLDFSNRIRQSDRLIDVRQRGTILAMEIRTDEKTSYMNSLSGSIQQFFLNKGIILRPLGNVLYILPPYCITDEDLAYIYVQVEKFLNELAE